MKTKTTKIIGIFLSAVILLAMLGAFSLTASAADTPYSITLDSSIENGSVAVPPTMTAGSTVTFMVTPKADYAINTVTVSDGLNSIPTAPGQVAGAYTFTMPASNVTITATFKLKGSTTPSGVASVITSTDTLYYSKLESAFAAAAQAENSELKLRSDLVLDTYITVESGKFTLNLNGCSWGSSSSVLYIGGTADIKITDTEGGVLKSAGEGYPTIGLYGSARLEIAGGTLQNVRNAEVINMSSNGGTSSTELTVSGGVIQASNAAAIKANGSSVTVTGGSFENTSSDIYYEKGVIDLSGHSDPTGIMVYNGTGASVTVSDSTVKLPEGYTMLDQANAAQSALAENQLYGVGLKQASSAYIASVTDTSGTTNYTNLAEAFEAASQSQGSELKLLNNFMSLFEIRVDSGSFTLDLNGKTLAFSSARLFIGGTADVRIIDTAGGGAIRSTDGAYDTIVLVGSAKLEVAGGTIENLGEQDAISLSYGGSKTSSSLTVSGGVIKSANTIAISAYGSSVTVTGGVIESGKWSFSYASGLLDLSGHPNPAGLSILNAAGASVTVSDSTIKLPGNYGLMDESGTAQTTLTAGKTYTVRELPNIYSVTVDSAVTNGTVTASPTDAAKGETVTLTVTPDEGFELDTVTVFDKNGDPVTVDENNRFIMPESDVIVSAIFVLDPHFHEKEGYEIIWSETFDDGSIPEDITPVNVDGDGYSWTCELEEKMNHICKYGYGCVSSSYINSIGVLDTHHLLKLPSFDLDSSGEYLLSFMVRAVDELYPDSYNVHISLDGGETNTWSRGAEVSPASWTEVIIDLTPYAGETVTVIIEHKDSDKFRIAFDCMYLYKKITAEAMKEEINKLNTAVSALEALVDSNTATVAELKQALAEVDLALDSLDTTYVTHDELTDDLADALVAVNSAINKLNNETVPAIQSDVSKNSGDIADLNNTVDNLTDTVDNIKNNLSALSSEDGRLAGLISSLDTSLSALSDSLDTLEGRVDTAEADIDSLEAELAAKYAALKAQTDKNGGDINAINDTLKDINDILTTLSTKTDVQAEIDILDALINDLTIRLEANEGSIGANSNAISALQSTLSSLQTDIAAQNTALSQSISSLSSTLTALDNRVTQNEQDLSSLKTELDASVEELNQALAESNKLNAKALADAVTKLNDLIAQAEASVIYSYDNEALVELEEALKKADVDNKAELTVMIEKAEETLDAAIKALQKTLDDAKTELDRAIADGDTELDGKLSALNGALAAAKSALEAADTENKKQLSAEIEEAETALQAAIDAVSAELDYVKQRTDALESENAELRVFIITVCVISGVAFCGCGTLAAFYIIDKKKKL